MQRLMFLLILILSLLSFSCEEDEFSIEDEINSIRPIQSISIKNTEGNSLPNSNFFGETDAYAERGYLIINVEDRSYYYDLNAAVHININRDVQTLSIIY